MLRFINDILKVKSDNQIIVVDARLWHNGRTGIGRVSELFIKQHSFNNDLIIIGPVEIKYKFNVNIIETKVDKFGLTFLIQNLILNLIFVRNKTFLIIYPHYFSTGCFLKKIVIVHDLMAITHYKYFFKRFKYLKKISLKLLLKISLINSTIICPSRYSKNILFDLFNKKSIFIPNGSLLLMNYNLLEIKTINNKEYCNTQIQTVGYVGNFRPHKNIEGIKLFCKLNNYQLLFFSDYKSNLERSDDLLVEFYIKCDAIIMLSFCEGFGIPIIEAAMFGKYIFASKIPAFLELNMVGLNYVDESTIVDNPKKSNKSYTESYYCFSQLNIFIRSIYANTENLSLFKKMDEYLNLTNEIINP
jgi:glycosyltransferase involved in cell wall biosynthesis